MPAGLLIKLRPTGPWRIGPDSGVRDRVGRVYHSDSLYAAVSSAMARLDSLDAWLDATARAEEPAVRLGSCFPYQGDTLLVAPPRTLWPPAQGSSKVRWKGARFVPIGVVETLAAGRALSEGAWAIDGESECLVPQRTPAVPGPFRVAVRSHAAVDRDGTSVTPHSTACLEFTSDCGLWTVAQFADDAARERWTGPLTAAFRLLADSGFGGERSQGWGRAEMPQITAGELSSLLLRRQGDQAANAYWLLSLFHPAANDSVDWQQGDYQLTTRGGRIESPAGWGEPKKLTRMVAEGSVIVAATEPKGSAPDVAPDGFAHPVYRSGFAVTLPIALAPAPKVTA
jgi:CRISPR type III-A-associated RAMP protein Csm4